MYKFIFMHAQMHMQNNHEMLGWVLPSACEELGLIFCKLSTHTLGCVSATTTMLLCDIENFNLYANFSFSF